MRRIAFLLGLIIANAALPAPSVAAGRVFYDGFESGNTDLWRKGDYRNRCRVVSAAADGVSGPLKGQSMASCNWNGTVAWNDPAAFETLLLPVMASSDEIFYRVKLRLDKNVARTEGSAAKLLRIFVTSPAYNDVFAGACTSTGLCNAAVSAGNQLGTYWGGAAGDTTNSSMGWHEVEYYFQSSTGTIRVWHDGVLVRSETGVSTKGTPWTDFYLVSNFSDSHDAENQVYFDEIEVFTDAGNGATGSMGSGTITMDGAQPLSPNGFSVR